MSKSKNAVVTTGVFDPAQLIKALPLAVRKLDPRHMARNPVMFVVTVGSVATTVLAVLHP
ncbi:Potassium-transporting ATPase B chain [Mycobacteroides abscessus]|nr:Potassium-transporting ATPase B chain [Mycobacteroides abscessus]